MLIKNTLDVKMCEATQKQHANIIQGGKVTKPIAKNML